ncbi:phosphoglycerate mutase [Candidatus Vecturithrix granuli]|uniref:Phosphoglycerate mutase n=1 Tax=Vecturithrix granuli TaxID=1499967 RepID=A0A081C326_VECG1|nr:phosphoglycerate mutase [Candidatus Vecturithrix granuli]
MKRVYLLRHAKSSWQDSSLEDFERPLNKRGKQDAPEMGQRLRSQHVLPDLIISSPAKRAVATAKIFAEEIGYPKKQIVYEAAIYEADTARLQTLLHGLENNIQQVMLCGHNPGLTMLAEYLSGTLIDNIPTCGIVCVDFAVDTWQEIGERKGTLIFFDYPKKHSVSEKQ